MPFSISSIALCQDNLVKDEPHDSLNYNKTVFLSLGIGSIEFTNLNLEIKVYDNLYFAFDYGGTNIPTEHGFLGSLSAEFIKLGLSWRALQGPVTPRISVLAGTSKVDAQESTPQVFIPDRAQLASVLLGAELRYESGLIWGIWLGERYSKYGEEKRYSFGFQINIGWSL